jgi:basic amino acid/polyamine antiporter, APA family
MIKTPEGLTREIGVFGLSANVINSVVGAGIFVLPAIVAEKLGSASILAYLFCGMLMTCIMLCFAEVGSKVTRSGGAYSYIEIAFGKYVGFLALNLFVLGVTVLACAAIANAMTDTLSYLIPVLNNKVFRIFFLFFIFCGLAILNSRGVKQGIMLVKITTIMKLTPLLLLVLVGSGSIEASNLEWIETPSLSSIGQISLVLFFAFQGAENSLSVGGEIRKPDRTIPLGILIAFLIIFALYISIQLIAQGVLGESLADFKAAPLAEVARKIMGPHGITLIIIGASISMFGYLSGDTLNMPRVIYAAARDGVLPIKLLSKIHTRFATPFISIIVFTSLGFVFAVVGEFRQLAILSSASILLIYLGVTLSLLKLRSQEEKQSKGFRVAGGFAIPLFTIVTILWLLSNMSSNELISIGIFISALTVIYFAVVHKKKKIYS